MRLRDFLLLGLAAVAILNSQGAFARDGDKVYRLGILSPAAGPVQRIRATALPELARLGFTEGHNLVVEARVGTTELLPAVALFRMRSISRSACLIATARPTGVEPDLFLPSSSRISDRQPVPSVS
jgi:hypothetical protein